MSTGSGNGKPDEPTEEKADDQGASAPDVGTKEDAGAPETGMVEVPPSREQLEAVERERDELKDALLRRRAEFENFRKRSERDQQTAATDAAAAVLRRLVDTVDNLERALAAKGEDDALRQGVELTLRDLLAAFEAQGVLVLDPLGQRFDPQHHQALLHEPVAGVEEGVVAEVFRKGYAYRERLLRPALVKVASGAAPPEEPVDGGGAGEVH